MITTLIAGAAALLGILLGGGVRAWEAGRARTAEQKSLLSALVCEVEAVTRLARHRQYVETLTSYRTHAQSMVEAGLADQPAPWFMVTMTYDYFATYHASLAKIGQLDPYCADRITRFYLLAKAALENYRPESPWQKGVTAAQAVAAIGNDIDILMTAMMLGDEIAGFRQINAPAGQLRLPAQSTVPHPELDAPVG